uniref:Uncharacterized protein n=1 Tax=Panagrolaimus sp. ES5 TaxID=591445 RepID=A0AC34G5E7_9BILA
MNFTISNDFIKEIEKTYYYDNEADILQEFETIFNDGFIQMDTIKQKLVGLDAKDNSSKQIFITINYELKKLDALNKKFDTFKKNVQATNQKCMETIKECQDREDELKIEHPHEKQRLNEKIENKKKLEIERDIVNIFCTVFMI